MKRADDTKTAIHHITKLYNINIECSTIEHILQNLHVSNKELEYLTIKLLIDKYKYNKTFYINRENFTKCRDEVRQFLE